MTVTIEIDGDLINWLVSVQWLDRTKADDRCEIAAAIMRMLADSARG